MTQMVKDSAGEQSGAYKAMFLMQQAIAIGQAIISTELAATKALELGPILGIPASTLVRGMGLRLSRLDRSTNHSRHGPRWY